MIRKFYLLTSVLSFLYVDGQMSAVNSLLFNSSIDLIINFFLNISFVNISLLNKIDNMNEAQIQTNNKLPFEQDFIKEFALEY